LMLVNLLHRVAVDCSGRFARGPAEFVRTKDYSNGR
jgi:hypothetical protein